MNDLEQLDSRFKKGIKWTLIITIILTAFSCIQAFFIDTTAAIALLVIVIISCAIGVPLVKIGEKNFLGKRKIGVGVAGTIVLALFAHKYAALLIFAVFMQAHFAYKKIMKNNPQPTVASENVSNNQPKDPFEV